MKTGNVPLKEGFAGVVHSVAQSTQATLRFPLTLTETCGPCECSLIHGIQNQFQ